MDEAEQYFGYLFSKWRQEQEKDLTKKVGEVQDAVLRSWMERGGGEGGSREGNTGPSGGARGKRRDPDEPKRPLASFMLFLAEKKDELKLELPSLNSRDVSRELGRRWGLLEQEEKQVYIERADQLLLAYKGELATYKARMNSQAV